jgi:hypothetical protein
MPRPHGDAVHGQPAGLVDHRGGVVVASGAGACDHDHEIRLRSSRAQRCRDLVGVVGDDRQYSRPSADLAGLGGEHQ